MLAVVVTAGAEEGIVVEPQQQGGREQERGTADKRSIATPVERALDGKEAAAAPAAGPAPAVAAVAALGPAAAAATVPERTRSSTPPRSARQP